MDLLSWVTNLIRVFDCNEDVTCHDVEHHVLKGNVSLNLEHGVLFRAPGDRFHVLIIAQRVPYVLISGQTTRQPHLVVSASQMLRCLSLPPPSNPLATLIHLFESPALPIPYAHSSIALYPENHTNPLARDRQRSAVNIGNNLHSLRLIPYIQDIICTGKIGNNMIETHSRIEPCLFEDRIPADLADLVVEIQQAADGLGRDLQPESAAELADFVRIMNCYYSNLIEGHNTQPRDIERALAGAEMEGETRSLALEARAHVIVQRRKNRGTQ